MTEDTTPPSPQPQKTPTPKIAVPKTPVRKVFLNTQGAVPQSKVKLMSSTGAPVPTRKPAAPTPKPTPTTPTKLSPEEEARIKAEEEAKRQAEEEAQRKAEEEYARQMEEYNRQMEEYNKQMEALRQKEEEERRKAEEERRKAEEEAKRKAAEEAARRKAEEEAARLKAEEDARRQKELALKVAEMKRMEAEAKRLEAEALRKELEAMAGDQIDTPPAKQATKTPSVSRISVTPHPAPKQNEPEQSPTNPLAASLRAQMGLPTGSKGSGSTPQPKVGASVPKSGIAKPQATAVPHKATAPTTTPITLKKAAVTPATPQQTAKPAPAAQTKPIPGTATRPVGIPKTIGTLPKPSAGSPPHKTAPAVAPESQENQTDEDQVTSDEMSEADAARQAYLEKLQAQAEKQPLYKNKAVIAVFVFLVVLVGSLLSYVLQQNAANEKERRRRAEVNALLKVSQEINRNGVDNLKMAKDKGIDLSKATMKNAKILFRAILHPSEFDTNGNAIAQNAALFLGIMAEMNPDIQSYLLTELAKNADTILPQHFNWMLQRLAVSGIASIKDKLLVMSDTIAKKPKFSNQPKCIQSIWDVLVLHVDTSDVPRIITLLKDKGTDDRLTKTLVNNLLHIVVDVETDLGKKKELGDQIFEALPEKRLKAADIVLANSASPKALNYYKEQLADPKKWAITMPFLGMWGDDTVYDLLMQKLEEAPKLDPDARYRLTSHVTDAIRNTLNKDRAYPIEKVDKMVSVIFEKINENTSDFASIVDKTDEGSAHYIGDSNPTEYATLKKRLSDIESARRQKIMMTKLLATKRAFPWVTTWLDRLSKDPDANLQNEVKNARRKVEENTKKNPIS